MRSNKTTPSPRGIFDLRTPKLVEPKTTILASLVRYRSAFLCRCRERGSAILSVAYIYCVDGGGWNLMNELLGLVGAK